MTATSTKLCLLAVSLGGLPFVLTPALRGEDQEMPALAARIDQHIAAAWDKSVKPAPLAEDAEFFRRVHLDLAGRIPSVTEIRDFLDDDRPDKRRLWVERILQADPEAPKRARLPQAVGARQRQSLTEISGIPVFSWLCFIYLPVCLHYIGRQNRFREIQDHG